MDVYSIVTDKIVGMLKQGTIPWRKPWNAGSGMPRNLCSNREYRGVNVFLLAAMPYASPYWLTYKQAAEKGGHVRQGEKSTLVVFWKLLDHCSDDEASKAGAKIPLLRYYHLFNLEQCSGIPAPVDPDETVNPFTPIETADQIINGYLDRPQIHHGGNRAFYRPAEDHIQMPHKHTFDQDEDYYAVLMHELGHSTGAKHRLVRKEVVEHQQFGSDDYSTEELVAEFTASYLCAVAGISNATIERSAAYIEGWLSVLRKDNRMIISASAKAQAAADWILGRKVSDE